MTYPRLCVPRLALLVLVFLPLAACTDTEQVFVERPLFEDPPDAAQGFLGYDDVEEKLVVCGNCHIGQQSEWEETGHAQAWDDLQASGHAQESCEGCHTVGANGTWSRSPTWGTPPPTTSGTTTSSAKAATAPGSST